MESVMIKLIIKNCTECPKDRTRLTKGYGYATDHMCSLMNDKITSGYVEWSSDINPVPDWCPIKAQ